MLLQSLLISALAAASAAAESQIHGKREVCTPKSFGDLSKDDTPAIMEAIASCGNGGTTVIPQGTTYSLRTMLDFKNCKNCDFQIEGTIKSSSDTDYWSGPPAIIYLKNVQGAKIRSLQGTGTIDASGQAAWDRFATDTNFKRPTILFIQGGADISVSNLKFRDPPNAFFGQKGGATRINFSHLDMSAISKSNNQPRHTDGFDVGESRFTSITDCTIVNQDDCIAFKSGCNYVDVQRVTCAGTNHGLVVGSLGKDNADYAKNINVKDIHMINCGKAAGIKVYEGGDARGSSTVTNVTISDVLVDGCDYGFQLQSCYGAKKNCDESPSEAIIDQIFLKNFHGSTNDKKAPVTANINCPAAGTCNLHFSDWDVKPPSGTAKILCDDVDNADLGISCEAGASG